MRENGVNGHIVHVNSVVGHKIIDVYPVSMYGVSKYAVTCHAGSLKTELREIKSMIKVTVSLIRSGSHLIDYDYT